MPRKGANRDPPPSTKEPVFLESESGQEGASETTTPFRRLENRRRPVGGEPSPGILDLPPSAVSLPAGDTANHQGPLKIPVSGFKPKDFFLPFSLLCTPAGNQVRIASHSLSMIMFPCFLHIHTPCCKEFLETAPPGGCVFPEEPRDDLGCVSKEQELRGP